MTTTKKNLNKEIIALFSGQSRMLTLPKLYVQLTKTHSLALVLNQTVFWSDKSKLDDGWFHKTYEEWFEETHIPERTLRRRFEKLADCYWIETKVKAVDGLNILHIRPNMDKIIESIEDLLSVKRPNRPLCPDGSEIEPNTCTEIAPTGQLGRGRPATLSGSSIYTYEKIHMKDHIPPNGVSKDSFGLKQMLEDNPHCIPETMIVDWLEVRRVKKAKITLTAWNATNSILKILVDRGLGAVACFENMVARGWQGIKVSYFQDELNALSPSPGQLTKEQRAANELKTKERELKAQEEKRKEIDAAKSMGNVIGTIRSTMGFSEASKKAAEEMKHLGLSATEYHAQVLRQARAG